MSLPDVNLKKFQQRIADAEHAGALPTFSRLCNAVAQTGWAQGQGLTPQTVADLIRAHNIPTATTVTNGNIETEAVAPMPDVVEEDEAPAAATPAATTKPVVLFDEWKKGRKQCPNCQKFLWIGHQICACGQSFVKANEEPQAKVISMVRRLPQPPPDHRPVSTRSFGLEKVGIPAGECPVPLRDTEPETVLAWGTKVREKYVEMRKYLTLSGLIYFARTFYDVNQQPFKKVKALLQEQFCDE